MGLFIGVAVLVICAIITGERKYLIPSKRNDSATPKTTTNAAKAKVEVKAITKKAEPEFKNPIGLNLLLYIGCFLVIAAFMGYVSTVDEALIPPIVITVSIVALIASLLIFKFVKFLKPSSYAFNVSSLIMFFFWIPSLEALGLDWEYAITASFFFLTGAGIISAGIFKHKALWYAPALSLIGLILFGFLIPASELANDQLSIYPSIIIYCTLGVLFRYFWKAKVTWLPLQTRHVIRTCSFIYPIFGGFVTFGALCDDISNYPFILTICAFFLSLYVLIDSILNKSKKLVSILRVCFELICATIAIDICAEFMQYASEAVHTNIITGTILISSIIQAFISIGIFAAKHDEESHANERLAFTAAIIGLAFCTMIGNFNDTVPTTIDDFGTIIVIFSQFAIIIFSIIALILDRNALLLIVTSLALSDIAIRNFEDSPAIACTILSVGGIIFSLCSGALKHVDQKHALKSSISAAVIAAGYSLLIGQSESLSYIPILGIGISLAIQGFIRKNSALRICGVYLTALGLINAWVTIRGEFAFVTYESIRGCVERRSNNIDGGCLRPVSGYPGWTYVLDLISCLILPAAAFILSIFDPKKTKLNKDGAKVKIASVNAYIGLVLAVISAITVMPIVGQKAEFLSLTFGLIMLVSILIWSAAKKWLGFEITAFCAILFLVLEHADNNVWVALIIAGLSIISIVVYVSYRNYKKLNTPKTAIAPSTQNTNIEEPKETPKAEEKSEEPKND